MLAARLPFITPPQVNSKGTREAKSFYVTYGKNVMSARMLELSLLGVGTVLRLERDAWSMVKMTKEK